MFKLKSDFIPAGDQINAIKELVKGVENNEENQVLLGVTGSGKTFTMANVIQQTNKTTMILSHNKTLAAQLYSEFKTLFPENKVEYFVSYFDYYRPEAYMPKTDTYIDKTSKSNWDLEAMRISTLNSLVTDKNTIVIASVAAIYGALEPKEYESGFYHLAVKQVIKRKTLLLQLVKRHYARNNVEIKPGVFQAHGDIIKIAPGWTDAYYIRVSLFGDEIEGIAKIDALTGEVLEQLDKVIIFPANAYTTKQETINNALVTIKAELKERLIYLNKENKLLEAQRLEQRVNHDIESMEEFGLCPGIENYARHIDGRGVGERPFTLLDYLPKDSLLIIDESHMMIPQLNGMYNGDRARKETLVNYGFRMPSALDNRPLRFDEFDKFDFPKVYVSATPSLYEIDKANGVIVKQIIRPTGLLDPKISIEKKEYQIESIYDHLQSQKKKKERTFILTTTIRMAEELTRYLKEKGEKIAYIHNELKTFERSEVLRKLRKGIYDTVVGINLLKEGIDVPEVSLILILDADLGSFFRSTTALIQISGRASRNKNGKVVFYADKMSKAMQETIDITKTRRALQKAHNKEHGITPKTIKKAIPAPIQGQAIDGAIQNFMSKGSKVKETKAFIEDLRKQMLQSSKDLNFERAAQIRDIILELEN